MRNEVNPMEDIEFIQKVRENLSKSSTHYEDLIQRKKNDLQFYSGNFWTDDLVQACDRKGRINRSFTFYPKYCSAIVSPFSKSPYHAEIEDPDGIYSEIQEQVNFIENQNNMKYVLSQALKHATIQGVGFFILSIKNGKITPEIVRDVSQVALDPTIYELDGSDASWGAIVNYIGLTRAKRLYGDDVITNEQNYALMDFGSQWVLPSKDQIPFVTYYELNDAGSVDMYQCCGNKIVNKVNINIDRIPIYRVCFNEIVVGNKIDYNGIVDMTKDLQFGLNLGYSTLLERANRSPKAQFLMTPAMYDGLDEFYKKLNTKESMIAAYNPDGDRQPIPIVEQYQTQDLMATIQSCNDLMASTIGIPSMGLNPMMKEQTAAEILTQQANSESNVGILYENAYQTIFSFSRNIIQLLCYENNIDKLPEFKLINGPQVITKLMKRRQELLAVSNMVDDTTRKIVAKHYMETLDADVKDGLVADIVANSPEINWISDSTEDEDPRAVNILSKMNNVLNETQQELEAQISENGELKKTIQELQLQLINQKEQNLIDLREHEDKMKLEWAKLGQEQTMKQMDMEAKAQENSYKVAGEQARYEKEILGLEKEKMKLTNEAIKANNAQIDKETKGQK